MDDLDSELGLDALDSTIVNEGKPAGRPTFLKVLCILSFVGTGLGMIQGLFIWMMAGVYSQLFTGIGNAFGGQNTSEMNMITRIFNAFSFWGVSILVGSLICLLGAIFMWNLKKWAYFVYILGQLLPIVGCYLLIASLPTGEFGGAALMWVFFFSIFPVAFIIMYGLNYKHLK